MPLCDRKSIGSHPTGKPGRLPTIPLCPRANEHTQKDDQRKPAKRTIIHPLKKSEGGSGTGTAHPVYPYRSHYFAHGYPQPEDTFGGEIIAVAYASYSIY